MTDEEARNVGIAGPETWTKALEKSLSEVGLSWYWTQKSNGGWVVTPLWVVDVEAGIPDETRDRFREAFEMTVPRLVVLLSGGDILIADRSVLLDLIELDVRELLDDVGLNGEAVPVVRSREEVATAIALVDDEEVEAQRDTAVPAESLDEEASIRGARDYSVSLSVDPVLEPSGLPVRQETPEAWIVPVFYGTDRARTDKPSPQEFFGPGRGELSFGMVTVSLPKQRHKGELPTPSWWKPWQSKNNPSRFVLLLKVTPMDKEPFLAELRQVVEGAPTPEALIFLHGFKVPFAEATERAAQVALDLEFSGVPLVYSWPSEGKVAGYTVDEANVEWSAPHFEEFLRLVIAESGARTVHVIAHSMGNRALVRALTSLQVQGSVTGGASLRQIIFAAPDVDRDTFVELAARFHGRAERFTLYGSSNDRALKISRLFHHYPRAGESGENMALVDGVDTIDSSAADTSLIGHSAYGSKRSILSDISLLLRYGLAPDGRFGFQPRQRGDRKYWLYQP